MGGTESFPENSQRMPPNLAGRAYPNKIWTARSANQKTPSAPIHFGELYRHLYQTKKPIRKGTTALSKSAQRSDRARYRRSKKGPSTGVSAIAVPTSAVARFPSSAAMPRIGHGMRLRID